MEHLDADLLSLLALGEPLGTDADAAHLAGCPVCSDTLRGLRHAVHIATLDPRGVELEKPGSQNWTAIHQALGLSPALATDPLNQHSVPRGAPPERSAIDPATAQAPLNHGSKTASAPAPIRPSAKNRAARPGLWMMAAAAGIILGTAAGWVAAGVIGHTGTPSPSSTQTAPASIVLAQTSLSPLPAHTGSGDARVEQLPDGTRQLMIRLSNDHITGFRGVWVRFRRPDQNGQPRRPRQRIRQLHPSLPASTWPSTPSSTSPISRTTGIPPTPPTASPAESST